MVDELQPGGGLMGVSERLGLKSLHPCGVCDAQLAPLRTVGSLDYFECTGCGSLQADPTWIARADAGEDLRAYDESYWKDELAAARERSYSSGLARVAEVLLYARRPVRSFVDIGSGPGFLLDALSFYLPASREIFWGVELYPPAQYTSHPNFIIGSLASTGRTFDAGICMEVFEHLTPRMLRGLARDLAASSTTDSIYLINTGLPEYVKNEDPDYLDPLRRGHIFVYSIKAIEKIFSPHGFRVIGIPGKTWAYLLEYDPSQMDNGPITDRIWKALESNKSILRDPQTGNLMHVLGLDTARAYLT